METDSYLKLFVQLPAVLINVVVLKAIALAIIIFVLLSLLAIVVGAEIAFFTLSSASVFKEDKTAVRRSDIIKSLLEKPEKLMASFWVSGVFLKILLIVHAFCFLHLIYSSGYFSLFSISAIGIFIVISIYFFGEVLPKIFARAEPSKFVINTSYVVYSLYIISSPLAFLVNRLTKKTFSDNPGNGFQLSVEDLSNAIELASDGVSEEEDILKGIVKFGNMDVSEIIQPRVDVVAVDFRMSLSQILKVVVESEYSRIPVFSSNFDNIKGILFVKDLLPFLNEKDTFRWQSLIRPTYFVPETKKVKELLTEFQNNKNHMAVVVDEYGGMLGIVTLEDILEEIVGEISDESDEDEKMYSIIDENTYMFDGKTLLNDFYKIFQTNDNLFEDIKGDADTLAGLLLEIKGEIPDKNEQIALKEFIFQVEAADMRRIQKIKVTKVKSEKA